MPRPRQVFTANMKNSQIWLRPKLDDTLTALNPITGGAHMVLSLHRVDGCVCDYICRINGSVSGDVDVYDIIPGTATYKTSAGGAPIDGSVETWTVVHIYDQNSTWDTVSAGVPCLRIQTGLHPELKFNATDNGYAATVHTDITDGHRFYLYKNLGGSAESWSEVGISNSTATMFIGYKPDGTPPTVAAAYSGERVISDGNYMGMHRAVIGGADRMWAYNWDGNEDRAGATYTNGTWNVFTQVHDGGSLSIYKDGILEDTTSSGNTSSLSGVPTVSYTPGNGVLNGETSTILIFNTSLTDEEIERLALYIEEH